MNLRDDLIKIFESWSGEKVKSFSPLPESGSPRKYFRIQSENKTAVGVFNLDKRENRAFIYLTKHFLKYNLNVPRLYSVDFKNNIYLLEDLGDQTLISLLTKTRTETDIHPDVIEKYKKIIEQLPKFQITARKNLVYSNCYPRTKFDKQSIIWDLNYFKYFFLKIAKISFDEQKLEDDYQSLTKFLMQADCNYFLYRDLNSTNIMLKDGEPFFIDYQGGRKGALQYDIASLLFDSKADIPQYRREELLEYYLALVRKIKKIDNREFLKFYSPYILIRLLQMFGAYGFRGYIERKEHFINSIPLAVKILLQFLDNYTLKIKLPEITSSLNQIIRSEEVQKLYSNPVTINT